MKRFAVRLGLSLMVAAGWWVQRLPAQTAGGQQPVLVVPSQVAPAVPLPQMPISSADAFPGSKGPILSYFNKHGRCCSSDVNSTGCGGTRAELQFILGSCRYWFGEPCLPHKKNTAEK